jgi:hypothetical protein
LNCQEKNYKFIRFKPNDNLPHAKLYSSTGLSQFHGLVLVLSALYSFKAYEFISNFQIFRPEHHRRDASIKYMYMQNPVHDSTDQKVGPGSMEE